MKIVIAVLFMRRKKHRIKKLLYLSGIFLTFSTGFIWWQIGIQPVNKNSDTYQNFTIEKGTGLRRIADNLKSEALIRDPYTFLLVVKILGIDGTIQAGQFELSPGMDIFTIAKKLTRSTTDIRVTIPEGKRAEEIADILSTHIPSLATQDISAILTEHEGYLFPDTYNFEKQSSINEIINHMLNNFEKKYSTLRINSHLPKDDIVIIASMIERETRHDEDRPLVASVIFNRLGIGMKLDIDATVQYGIGYYPVQHSWWKKGLTSSDLTVDYIYNTYTNAGLPPAAIANPGLASLEAAANPADTNYFYYFTDKNGINHYARTLTEQNENIRRYGL